MYSDILKRAVIPLHKRVMEDYTHKFCGDNSSCGDSVELYLKMDGDYVKDASFDGYACSIATASVDYLCDKIIGKEFNEIKEIARLFNQMLCARINSVEAKKLGELTDFEYVAHMRSRTDCAKLSWKTLLKGIEQGE